VAALAALESAICAEELHRGMPFPSLYPIVLIAVAFNVVLVFGPLILFTPALLACRPHGYFAYMTLASRYVHAFEERWLSGRPTAKELLGTDDLQSLADLTNSIGVEKNMHYVPAGAPLLTGIVMATLGPMLPLLLFKYSLADLFHRVI